MYENCCDPGIKMPSLYLQTFGARSYSTDYAFDWTPDAMIINLGVRASFPGHPVLPLLHFPPLSPPFFFTPPPFPTRASIILHRPMTLGTTVGQRGSTTSRQRT